MVLRQLIQQLSFGTEAVKSRSKTHIYKGAEKHLMFAMLLLVASLFFIVAGCVIWYWAATRYSRRRAGEIGRWLQTALAGQGQVTAVRRVSASRLRVPVRLTHSVFRQAIVIIDMIPYELPFHWLLSKIKGQSETLTFQADLDLPPAFALHVQNFRWYARSSRRNPPAANGWTFEQAGPVVISTRSEWQKEIFSTMTSLARGNTHDFLSIDFQRRSPHFSVTLPLEAISPESPVRSCVFESMKELASNSSASLF